MYSVYESRKSPLTAFRWHFADLLALACVSLALVLVAMGTLSGMLVAGLGSLALRVLR